MFRSLARCLVRFYRRHNPTFLVLLCSCFGMLSQGMRRLDISWKPRKVALILPGEDYLSTNAQQMASIPRFSDLLSKERNCALPWISYGQSTLPTCKECSPLLWTMSPGISYTIAAVIQREMFRVRRFPRRRKHGAASFTPNAPALHRDFIASPVSFTPSLYRRSANDAQHVQSVQLFDSRR